MNWHELMWMGVEAVIVWYLAPAFGWLRHEARYRAAAAYMKAMVAEREARGVKRTIKREGF